MSNNVLIGASIQNYRQIISFTMSDLFDKSNVFYYGDMTEDLQVFFLSEISISLS